MDNVLGLILFVVFIASIVGVAAGITWIVVRVSPMKESRKTPS